MSKHTLIIRVSSLLLYLLSFMGIVAALYEDYYSAFGLFLYASLISFIQGLASPTNNR